MSTASPLQGLVSAKQMSDKGNYEEKHKALRKLMLDRSEEFVVDSPAGPHPGITHLPTGFRIHVAREMIPPKVWGNRVETPVEKQASAMPPKPEASQIPLTGPLALRHALAKVDLDALETKFVAAVKTNKPTLRGPAVKGLNAIRGLQRNSLKPADLLVTRVPVIPPVFRPFTRVGDMFQPGDANELYAEIFNHRDVADQAVRRFGIRGAGDEVVNLYGAVKAVYGYGEPISTRGKTRQLSGMLQQVLGTSPKYSFLQRKLVSKPLDQVARATITVDPELAMDEIGLPEDMVWTTYDNHIQRRMVRSGMALIEAKKHLVDRSPLAHRFMLEEIKERPAVYTRAPAWHKYNNIAGWVKPVKGDQIALNPLVTTGAGADFDGDTVQISIPVSAAAVNDAKDKLMPQKMLMSGKNPEDVVPALKHEQILSLYSSQQRPAKAKHRFGSRQEALQAIRSGSISGQDEIEFPGSEAFA